MKEVVEFFKENPAQYLSTIGLDGKPKVRPFQFMLEKGGKLYFCTNNKKDVFEELIKFTKRKCQTAKRRAFPLM